LLASLTHAIYEIKVEKYNKCSWNTITAYRDVEMLLQNINSMQ
jgi:hypothetical protein